MKWFVPFFIIPLYVLSNPKHHKVVHGSASIEEKSFTLNVHAEDLSVIHWDDFSIGRQENVSFYLPHENAKVLNRVTGCKQSEIFGQLNSNGRFYLINPNGILFGPNSTVNTKAALFSTLDVSDKDFIMGEEELYLIDEKCGSILNKGQIRGDQLVFLSRQIDNRGKIHGNEVVLAAAEEILVQFGDYLQIRPLKGDGTVYQSGEIEALQIRINGARNPFEFAINSDQPPVEAVKKGGRIYLTGGKLSAEQIEVQSDCVYVESDASLYADAREIGNGGSIFVIGEELLFEGSAYARGGRALGDGGYIEISGHKSFNYHPIEISTLAPNGKTGTLLLDPNEIQIQSAMPTSGGFSNPYSGTGFVTALLNTSDLVGPAGLLNNNVTVTTDPVPAGTGNIIIVDDFTWASGTTLSLLPTNDLNVNALASATGAGSFIVTVGGSINVGTLAGTTPTGLITQSGDITLTAPIDLILLGGMALGASAELSSVTGSITASIGRNVQLTGGSMDNAYAQIGKGTVASPTMISSDIVFTMLGRNLVLSGGSALNTYAQIGHAPNGPGPHFITSSDITFPNAAIGGSLSLTGTSQNASAIIGHGNELSPNLISVSGDLQVIVSEGITLSGGASQSSHACIGFQDVEGGNTTFNVTSNSVDVQNVITGSITLNAGTNSNAVIGYYNNSIVAGGPDLTITNINVSTPITTDMYLNAGDTGGMDNGVAAIGTLAKFGTASSGITITTGTLSLNNAPTGDGSSRIINTLPINSVPYDISISATGVLDIVSLLGGTASTANFAEIYSGRNLTLSFSMGNLVVNTTTQRGFAQVRAYSTVSLNPIAFGDKINMAGSATDASGFSLIQAINGPVQFGTLATFGGTDVNIGDTTSLASSRILSDSGTSIFSLLGGNFTLQGGTGNNMPVAEIANNQGPLKLQGSDISITGGSGMLAYGQIASTLGDLTATITGNILLQGGSADQAYAQIGKGYITTETSIESSILFPSIGGNVQVLGGSSQGAYAQIGHSPFGNGSDIPVTGDLNFGPGGIFDYLTLQGGTALDTTAIIGFGNELSTLVSGYTGNIKDLLVTNAILLQTDPGGTARTHAIIGFHSPTTVSASFLTVNATTPGISIQTTSSTITGNAGDGSNATIGYYNSTNMGLVEGTIEQITVDSVSSITFQAGNDGGTGAGVASIGTFVSSGSTFNSNIQIDGTTVSFLGPTGGLVMGNDGSARCINSYLDFSSSTFPSANYDINMDVTDLIVYGGTGKATGFADVYSSNDLSVRFTNNFEVNASAPLQNGYAHVIADQTIDMGFDGALVSVIGGALFSADARIQSINGNVTHGTFQGGGADTINIGQANSLSTSQVITSTGSNNFNSAQNFSIQGGAGMNTVSLVRTDSGPFTVSAGQTLSITGGTGGDFASAEIRSLSGTGQVAASTDITLLGGGSTRCFAQINSDTGSITFPNIGNNLNITGGPGTNCYAQIGKGFVANATIVNSTLTFDNIGNNVTLTGSTMGADSYAQIGHSPFFTTPPPMANAISVEGDISMQNIDGKMTLNGGPGPAANTTAIIGHGNELTSYITTCSGDISIYNQGLMGIELNPGAPLLNTHAVIGFHSPAIHPMNLLTFNVMSNSVSVTTTSGPILVNGGDRSNAIIGYYNLTTPALMPIGVVVDIQNISVTCDIDDATTNRITLQAGNDMGTHDGVAIIGTDVSLGNSAISNINLSGNAINVLGPIGTHDGQALITNNRVGDILANQNVNFNNTNTITVFGGTSTMTGLAEVYSSGEMILNFMKGLHVGYESTAPTTLATSNQLVRSFGDMTMNMSPVMGMIGSIQIVGGASSPILTDISTMAGKILVGDTNQTEGAKNILIGSSSMLGSARMFTVTGDIFAQISGNTTLTGGMDAVALANIQSNTNLTLNAAGSVTLLGGSIAGAVARISSSFGKNLVFGKEGVTATGGVAIAEFRQFGFEGHEMVVHSGKDITLNANSRIYNDGNGKITALAGNDLYMNGDALIQNVGTGQLNTFSGVSSFFNDTSKVLASGGDIAIVVDNNYPTPPKVGPGRFVSSSSFEVLSPGKVRIFTAIRPQNNIQSALNGDTYTPGIEYVNTETEKWKIWYFSPLGGVPFTVFYKKFVPIPVVPTIVVNSISQVQFLQNLKTFDYPTLDFHTMTAQFNYCGELTGFSGCLEDISEYLFFRQLYLNYHTKSIDPLSTYW